MVAENNIKSILEQLILEHARFLKTVGMAPEMMPSPACEEKVNQLQAHLGSLPTSYREFLLLQDGFPTLCDDLSILPVSEVISLLQDRSKLKLERVAKINNNQTLSHCIVFGASPKDLSMYLFNPSDCSKGSEWHVIEIDEKGKIELKHSGFEEFLISQLEMTREAAEESEQGTDIVDLFAKKNE